LPKVQIIKQKHMPDAMPNFRNMGVILRSVLWVNGMALLMALAEAPSLSDFVRRMAEISSLLQPVLMLGLLLLYALNPLFARLRYWQGAAIVILLTMLEVLAIFQFGGDLYAPSSGSAVYYALRNMLLGAAVAALLLAYFYMRAQALSPALQKSRLQALHARIRPHFLFNSINAVLGIVRADPKRAETALEDMSDLFRMAMAYTSDLVPVLHEVALARQYLALEQLRLGERLKVHWQLEEMPDDALLPPLILQPLLENAVYHGIEPLAEGGVIEVKLYRVGKELHLELQNPCQQRESGHVGNKMALMNIRERLALQFDIEASYTVESGKDFYRVHIMLPYVKEERL
jgi:two-component system sensor histidine kinase AlgZ